MITKGQLRILNVFAKNIFKEYSRQEIKILSEEKSNNSLTIALARFKEEGIIKERSIGVSKLYTLNMENERLYNYLNLAIKENLPKIIIKPINLLKREIEKYTFFYSLVIFGSYADRTYKKNSDIDIAVIIAEKSQEKNIKLAINSANKISLLKIDGHVITVDDMTEMLKAEYANLGKEIASKNLPIYNVAVFYKVIEMGIKNGFKIIH